MKSYETISIEASPKDYYLVADIAGCSPKNVQLVIKQQRGDNYNIQKIFSGLLISKEDLKRKYRKKENK